MDYWVTALKLKCEMHFFFRLVIAPNDFQRKQHDRSREIRPQGKWNSQTERSVDFCYIQIRAGVKIFPSKHHVNVHTWALWCLMLVVVLNWTLHIHEHGRDLREQFVLFTYLFIDHYAVVLQLIYKSILAVHYFCHTVVLRFNVWLRECWDGPHTDNSRGSMDLML